MKVDRISKNISVLLLVIALFLLRPMALGYAYTNIGLVIINLATFVLLISNSFKISVLSRTNRKILLYIFSTYLPVFVFNIIDGRFEESKDIIIIINVVISLAIFFSYTDNIELFIKILTGLFCLIILSSIITMVMSFYNDFSKLLVLDIPIRNRTDFDSLKIYYPFSPLYTFFTTEKFAFPRFSFFFIEAGIASGFFSSLLFIQWNKLNNGSRSVIAILFIVGGVISFSTSFFPAFALGFIFNYLSKNKINWYSILILIALSIAGFLMFKKIPYIGYDAKSLTHASSFDDRVSALELSSKNFSRWIKIFSASLLTLLILSLKKDKLRFLSYFIPIFFTGLVNVTFYSPLFLAFCFVDIELASYLRLNKKKLVKSIVTTHHL